MHAVCMAPLVMLVKKVCLKFLGAFKPPNTALVVAVDRGVILAGR